jgi:hypothetical protein
VRLNEKEEVVSTKRRKPTLFEGLTLLGLAGLLTAILAVLIFAAGNLNTVNLWLIIVAFALICGFALPFILIFFGIIEEKTWLKAFGGVINKIPVIRNPSKKDIDPDQP